MGCEAVGTAEEDSCWLRSQVANRTARDEGRVAREQQRPSPPTWARFSQIQCARFPPPLGRYAILTELDSLFLSCHGRNQKTPPHMASPQSVTWS